jgi:hypothetical protein
MRLHGPQISTRPPQQLRAAATAKRARMQMPYIGGATITQPSGSSG